MNHVDVSTILFLAVPKPRIKHSLVQLQNVVCADHKKLIKGKKTGFNNKSSMHLCKGIHGHLLNNWL